MDLIEHEIQAEKCSICGEFPDELTVNTGRDQRFPTAFDELIPVGVPFYGQGQSSQYRRCPNCDTYFIWDDFPQMYGSGNNAEERLSRFSAKASRLLNNLFTNGLKAPLEPAEVSEYFDAIPLNPLLDELQSQVGKAPEIVTPFVPKLVSLLGKYDSVWVRDINNLLNAYASVSVKRAAEVEAAQAHYAFSIMEKHFAHASAVMAHNDLPKDWSHFRLLFYLNIIEFVEKETHERLLKGLLAELINFIRVCSIEAFNNNLYNLLTDFGPRYSWLEPFLPELARVKISELEEMRLQYEDDNERFRLDQLYY